MLSCYAAAGTTARPPGSKSAWSWQHFFNGSFAIKLPLNL
jgi:hypothetical protein